MKPTTLIIVRHGQTDWNAAKRFMGIEDVPLNNTGIMQAETTARALKTYHIDHILTSPMTRAKQTAQTIRAHHPSTPIESFDLIKERNFGILEGKTYEEANALYPQIVMGQMWQYPSFAPTGGESILDVTARAKAAITHIEETHKGKHIVLVSHGAYIRIFLSQLLSVPLEYINEYGIGNASISIARESSDGWEAHLINKSTTVHTL